jgi:hypothetical protein
MKCPKCGNITSIYYTQTDKKYCTVCNYEFISKTNQQRLDNVLSKFIRKSSGKRYYYNWIKMDLQIDYFVESKKFEIMGKIADVNLDNDFITAGSFKGDNIDNWIKYNECEISLETVEYLLKDLERNE